MVEHFDELLDKVGSFGRYQRRMIYFLLIPVDFFAAFMTSQLLFQVVVPDHWCHVPRPESSSLTQAQWRALTIPRSNETNKYSGCLMYTVTRHNGENDTFTVTNDTQSCRNGWEHDTSQMQETVATTHGWLCETHRYSHHVLAVNTLGSAVGTLILPVTADRFVGRRKMLFASLAIHVVFTVPVVWTSHPGLHLVLRFLAGLPFVTNILMSGITVLEVVGRDGRPLVSSVSWCASTTGFCFAALVAYLVPHWQHLALVSCLPPLCASLCLWLVPESPRWLLSKGQLQECAKVLLQIARVNERTTVSKEDLEDSLKALVTKQEEEVVNIVHTARYPKLRQRVIILLCLSLCRYVTVGVVQMGINVMPSNYFLSHFVLSVFQLPGNIIGWACTHYLGRRCTCVTSTIITAGLCVLAAFSVHDELMLLMMAASIKLTLTTGNLGLFLLTSEIFPTPIRSSGVGLYLVIGLTSFAACPYILHSGYGPSFPYWMLLALMLVSLALIIPLPETLGLTLPQTFQEAEALGSGRPVTVWINHWNLHKYPQLTNTV